MPLHHGIPLALRKRMRTKHEEQCTPSPSPVWHCKRHEGSAIPTLRRRLRHEGWKDGDKRKNEALAPGRWAAFTPAGLPRCRMETRTWASGQRACINCSFRISLKADGYALHRAKIPTANGACMLINQPMVFGMRADPLCASIVMVRVVPVVMVVVAASDHVPELVMHLQANHQCPYREQGAGKQGTLVRVELGNHGSAKVGHSSKGNFQKFRKLATSSACIRAVILGLHGTQLGTIHFTFCSKHADGGSSHRPSVPDRHGFIR